MESREQEPVFPRLFLFHLWAESPHGLGNDPSHDQAKKTPSPYSLSVGG